MRKKVLLFLLTTFLMVFCLGVVSCKKQNDKEIYLNQKECTMNIGDSVQLTADIDCTWESKDTTVATVNSTGLVVAVSLGETEIIAMAEGAKGTCKIVVTDDFLGEPVVSLNLKSQGMFVGDTLVCEPAIRFGNRVAPIDQFNYSITSSNESVASVDGCSIVALAIGETDIMLSLEYKGKTYETTKKLTVGNIVDVWFEQEEYTSIMGETFAIQLLGVDSNAEIDSDQISWTSENPDIVSCDNGTITSIANGSATITATYKGKTATCIIDVYQPIRTSDEFISVLKKTDGNYILMQDIDLSQTSMIKGGVFSGKIDGNGYALIGIHYPTKMMSLFGTFSGVIKNVEFRNVTFDSSEALIRCAVIADYIVDGARVENCYFDVAFGNIGSANYEWGAYLTWGFTAGVIAGDASGSVTVRNCYIKLQTPNNAKTDYTGMIVGKISGTVHLENVICEQAGELSYKAVGSGEIVEKGATGIYAKSAAASIAGSVLGDNWQVNDTISLINGIKVFNNYVPFLVNIEVESLNDDGYDVAESQTLYGFIGQTVKCDDFIKDIYGLTFDASNSDSSIVIEEGKDLSLRYNRNTYTVTLQAGGKEESRTYRYEEYCNTNDFSIKAPEIDGKVLIGWGENADSNFEVTEDVVGGPVYATPIYTYADFLKIKEDMSGNYALMNDIDPLAEKNVSEFIVSMIDGDFSGILDGQGYAIKNLTFYDENPEWYQKMALFDRVSGTLKDIGFDNFRIVPTNAGQSSAAIARYFTGTAKNVYVNATITKTYYQYNGQQYGAMFGTLENGAVIRDCFVRLKADGANCYYKYGYIAGSVSGEVRIENVLIVKASSYASLIAYEDPSSSIRSGKILIADEATVIDRAVDVLGQNWICDSITFPRIKKTGEENIVSGNIPYIVKYYFNSKENATDYQENPEYQQTFKGANGATVDISDYINGKGMSCYQLNVERSILSGVVTKNEPLVLEVYYNFYSVAVSSYDEFYNAVVNYPSAYIYLTKDIDPLAEKDVAEQFWTMIGNANNPFTGVIDGQGYAIKNLTYYDGSDTWNNGFGMFYQFNGTIKNISLENFKLAKDKGIVASSGVIARIFSGTAENVYVSVRYTRSYWQYDTQQSGGMFGIVKAGSTIKNCVVKMTTDGESKIGYLAGRIDGDVTIENFIAVTANNVGLFGCYNSGSSINGTACKSDATAATLIHGLLLGDEEKVINGADAILSDAWVCDGANMPSLRLPEGVTRNYYIVEVYFNSASDEAKFELQSSKKIFTEEKEISLSESDIVSVAGYTVNVEKSILSGVIVNGSITLKVYYDINLVKVATYDEFRAAVTSNPNAYILLADDIDPLTEKGITEQQWTMVSTEFTGVIDGQGYAIKNLTYYDGSNTWNNGFAMFSTFSGTIKNISLENFVLSKDKGVVQTCGVIARVFSGTAENVYVSVRYVRSYWQNDTQQSGGMFGCVKAGSIIKNCVVKMTTDGESKIGYLAGRLDGDATIENFVAVTASNVGLFGCYNTSASINGTDCKSDATAATLINGLLIDTEANVIVGADAILGEVWVCDGEKLPYLKR